MSEQPTVACILLTRDRPEMAARAVRCFREQTYPNKKLLVVDTGSRDDAHVYFSDQRPETERLIWNGAATETIGMLRNLANGQTKSDIIAHFDDDDVSHPNRISEQVALLQASGKEAVGYNSCLFWKDTVPSHVRKNVETIIALFPAAAFPLPEHLQLRSGEAWLYTNNDTRYALGTSLCYWRKTWERRPFEDKNVGEDKTFLGGVDSLGVSSHAYDAEDHLHPLGQPRMIASIHGGNTSPAYGRLEPPSWKRVPEFDAHCRKVMTL